MLVAYGRLTRWFNSTLSLYREMPPHLKMSCKVWSVTAPDRPTVDMSVSVKRFHWSSVLPLTEILRETGPSIEAMKE